MWYVIQTVTGQEDMVLDMVRSIIPRKSYNECFCIKRECMEKTDGESGIVLKTLFPGYVFLDTDTPKDAYYSLKNVPKLTKVLKNDDDFFLPVAEEEQDFLQNIQSEGHVVRLSNVMLDDERQITAADGAVGKYFDQIVKQRVRKRYVLIRQQFLGKERKIMLGIRVDEETE